MSHCRWHRGAAKNEAAENPNNDAAYLEDCKGIEERQSKLKSASVCLKSRYVEILVQKDSLELKALLFHEATETEPMIKARYKRLARLFHTDRNIKLSELEQENFNHLFSLIVAIKEEAIEELEHSISVHGEHVDASSRYYREKGHEYLERAIDMQHACVAKESNNPKEQQARWSKLKHYGVADLMSCRSDELRDFQADFADKAYQYYRAAAQSLSCLENQGDWFRHAQLRQDMMKSLYMQGKFVDAELSGICSLHLLKNNSSKDASKNIHETLSFLNKIRKASGRSMDDEQDVNPSVDAQMSQTALERMQANAGASITLSTPSGRDKFEIAIRSDLSQVLRRKLVHGHGEQIVRYKSPENIILAARKRANLYETAGVGIYGATIGIGSVMAFGALVDIADIVVAASVGSVLGGPVGAGVALMSGLVSIGIGVFAGAHLKDKADKLLEEPEIRECLNKMMEKALKAYKDQDYQLFFQILSEPYREEMITSASSAGTDTNVKKQWCLIDYQVDPNGDLDINASKIIKELLLHGFRADGVAYLLSRIGEVLLATNPRTLNLSEVMTQIDLDVQAKKIFKEIEKNKDLKEAIKALDEAVKAAQYKKAVIRQENQEDGPPLDVVDNIASIFKSLTDLPMKMNTYYQEIVATEYYGIPKEYLTDAEEAPFQARLDEIKQICMMNQIIMELLNGERENLTIAKKTFRKLRALLKEKFQFYSVAAERLDVLSDLMSVLDPSFIAEDFEPDIQPTAPMTRLMPELDLDELNRSLASAKNAVEKDECYLKLALKHQKLAEFFENEGKPLVSLEQWELSKQNYEAISSGSEHNQSMTLGLLRCLIKTYHYSSANAQLLTFNEIYSKSDEYWNLRTLAARHLRNYAGARYANTQALAINPESSEALIERRILSKLPKELNEQGRARTKIYEDYTQASSPMRAREEEKYRILSIDGGDVPSVVPAVWLSELERQTNRSVVNLFDLVAGSGMSAITAGGLVTPKENGEPKNRAFDLMKVHLSPSDQIFGRRGIFKYKDSHRCSVVKNYLGENTLLNQTLRPVVIPAIAESQAIFTFKSPEAYVFSSSYGGALPSIALYHACMAASAIPKYFSPYAIPGSAYSAYSFTGGDLVSHPAKYALGAASDYGHKDNKRILMWSLGTGDCVHSVLNTKPGRPNNAIDRDMYDALGSHYNRWQIYMDEHVALDDPRPEVMDILLDRALDYMEELEVRESPQRMSLLIERLTGEKDRIPSLPRTRSTFFKQQQPSSQPAKAHASSHVIVRYRGALLNGHSYMFTRHNVDGDGQCGFTVLNATRSQLAFALREAKTLETRQQLASEIQQALMTEEYGFSTPEWAELNQTLISRQADYDELIRDIVETYPKVGEGENQQNRNETLLRFLKNETRPMGKILFKNLQEKLDALNSIEASILEDCESEMAYDAYVNGLESHIWLGYQSALIYAKAEKINLYIWRESTTTHANLDDIQPVLLMHRHVEENSTRTVHMLHTHNFTHFDELKEDAAFVLCVSGDLV